MPHDAKGNLVQLGDTVIVRFKVTGVQHVEDYCNITLQALGTPQPADCYVPSLTTNAKLVEKVEG